MKLSTTFLILAVALSRAIAAPHRLQVREYDALEVRNPTDNSEHGQIHQRPQPEPYVHPLDHRKESYHMGPADNIKAAKLSNILANGASSQHDMKSAHFHKADAHTFSAHAALSQGDHETARNEFKSAADSHLALSEIYAKEGDLQKAADRQVAHHMSLLEAAQIGGNKPDMERHLGGAHIWAAEAKSHEGNTEAVMTHTWEASRHNAKAARLDAVEEKRARQAAQQAAQNQEENHKIKTEMIKGQMIGLRPPH